MTIQPQELKTEDRCKNYALSFPDCHKIINDRIYGVWVMGNNYSNNGNLLYGAYPNSLLKRIKALFPDKNKILHLFSGNVHDGITFDINPKSNASIIDDVVNIKNHEQIIRNCDIIIADPPYEDKDFIKYKQKPFNKTQVIRDLADITNEGTILTWLDTSKPMYNNDKWFLLGEIMVSVSTMHRYRGLCIFRRLA